jgi:hypothetical protein
MICAKIAEALFTAIPVISALSIMLFKIWNSSGIVVTSQTTRKTNFDILRLSICNQVCEDYKMVHLLHKNIKTIFLIESAFIKYRFAYNKASDFKTINEA